MKLFVIFIKKLALDLKNRFKNLVSAYTSNKDLIDSFWNTLENNYTEKHRVYHNFSHLEELFTYFDTYKVELKNADIVSFSIFYHDIIYNIWKKDNEEKSALVSLDQLSKINLSSDFLENIHQQIIATKTHDAIDNDTKWMIDFDLAILGTSSEVYSNYSKLIRNEYKLVPNLLYKKGRKKILQHFIDKPFIYATNEFRRLYENQAKLNLTNELNAL
ncbi:HD domain-containing protein [Tenacibaculum halocynthiae]|uniref:HD domain-containing protein n=1 Tax=Tenacibaculum halocynthiae TaxID=1254437 RepID=UPI003892F044